MRKETIGRKVLKFAIPALACAVAVLALTPTMNASTITYNLTVNACGGSGGCGTPSFGTITLMDVGSGSTASVAVVLTLKSGENFAGTGAGEALEFNYNGPSPITIGNVSSGFAAGVGGATASAFGSFTNFVHCTSCQGGKGPTGPLSFTVSSSGGGVTIANFIANDGGFFFASDIFGNGNTGNVGATGPTTSTPEPISSALVGSGLLSLFLLRRRARK